ncbi:hypothetical protein GE061_016278 [Apolygus lucorum]|uniref:Uncharacterized protein n=1 Tax=Apolygus lucorum TaxID=248454 RepID=A0A6A4JRF6_APOLU|nr:hypothetical protein GE061_016278 [Apolygus lucorum]
MKPDSDQSPPCTDDGRNRSSTEWTPSIIDDSDFEGRSSSSTFSWTDEAECTIAEQLKLRYEQFEAALYSEAPSDTLTPSERAEKEIWDEYTPHLRVTGKKINLILSDRSPDGSSRSGSPGLVEIIAQHPEITSDLGSSHKSTSTQNERSSSCRSVSSKTKEATTKEDPAVKEKMAKAIAEKLLEQACPNAKKVGLIPKTNKSHAASRKANSLSHTQYSTESDSSSFKENSHSFTVLPSKDISRVAQPDISLKPINFQDMHPHNQYRAKSSHLDSSDKAESKVFKPLSRNARNLSSARHSRRKFEKKEHETESMSDNPLDSPELTARHGFLPPIESLSVTPKLPSKRANSAMLRFTKTQPRTRPTTSRSKSLFLAPIESFSVCSANSKFSITPIAEHSPSVFSAQLPHCSYRKMNQRTNPPRWRY